MNIKFATLVRMDESYKYILFQKQLLDERKVFKILSLLKSEDFFKFSFDDLKNTEAIFFVQIEIEESLEKEFFKKVEAFFKRQFEKIPANVGYRIAFFKLSDSEKNVAKLKKAISAFLSILPYGTVIIFTTLKNTGDEVAGGASSKDRVNIYRVGRAKLLVFPTILEVLRDVKIKELLKEELKNLRRFS